VEDIEMLSGVISTYPLKFAYKAGNKILLLKVM